MRTLHAAATLVALTLAATLSSAQPIQLVPGTVNMLRDTRGANDVGIGQGDLFQYGADVVGGSAGTLLGVGFGAFTQAPFQCSPLAVNANFCGRTVGFNASRLSPWTLRFERGANALEVLGPSMLGAEAPVPFPTSVTLSGVGLTPTISWQVPDTFTPDSFRINIFDKGRVLSNGQADVIHSQAISAAASSFTVPQVLSSGLSLQTGSNYSVNLQLIETRNHVPFTNNNAEILRRSNSFFAFTPLSGNVPSDVALPTVVNGVYNFNIDTVGPSAITFIDPLVAIGYDYAIGAGNPNFASVLLPGVGDGQFTLEFSDAGGVRSVALEAGTQYFFDAEGVGSFSVRGIETSAALDPANVTAFITGLTFVSDGSFTGTQTPITVMVPEPGAWALCALGLAVIAARRRMTAR